MAAFARDGLRREQARLSRRRLLQIGGVAATTVALHTACTTTPPPAAPPTSGAAAPAPTAATPRATATPTTRTPKYGGTFAFAFGLEAPHLDVHQTGTALLHMWGPGVAYSRLVRFKAGAGVPHGTIAAEGDLAESWDQPDETTYIFKLRRGVRFHNIPPVNGREVTAEDVVYSFNRQIELKTNAGFLGPITRLEAPERYTVRISIARPDVEYPLVIAGGHNKIIAREVVDQHGDLKNGPTIGSGPFILEKWEPNSITTLVKNPDYFLRGLPYIDRLEFPRIRDDQARLAAFRAGQLSTAGTNLTPLEVEALRQQVPNAQFITTRLPTPLWELGINKKTGPTADRRVRQAIARALNRQELIDAALGGGGWFMSHFVLPGLDHVLPEEEMKRLYARDLNTARRLLTETGFPNGLDLELSVVNISQTLVSLGEQIVAQLRDAGVRARIKLVDNAQYADQILVRNEYQLYLGPATTVGLTNQDLFTRFHSQGTRGGQVLDDPRLDELIARQAITRDVEQRKRLLQEIQRYLITDLVPSAIITGSGGTEVWHPALRDFTVGLPSPASSDAYTYVWFDR